MDRTVTRALVVITAPLMLSAGAVAVEKAPETRPADPTATCAQMMQDPGVAEEGEKAMQEFMRAAHASETMTNMMALARRMGNGDVTLGMTQMMEVMGSMGGGMTGGPGGMGQPGKVRGRHVSEAA